MSDVFIEPDDAATPLTPEEKRDLIPTHIAFRSELNAAEQENIAHGQDWALHRRKKDTTATLMRGSTSSFSCCSSSNGARRGGSMTL